LATARRRSAVIRREHVGALEVGRFDRRLKRWVLNEAFFQADDAARGGDFE